MKFFVLLIGVIPLAISGSWGQVRTWSYDDALFDHTHLRYRRSTVPPSFSVVVTPTLSSFRVGEVNTIQVNFSMTNTSATLKMSAMVNRVYRVFTINNPRISYIGGNIVGNGPMNAVPTIVSYFNDQYTDSFSIDFGTFSNTGANLLDEMQNDIVVLFDVVARSSSVLVESDNFPIDISYTYNGVTTTVEKSVAYAAADWQAYIEPNVTVAPASSDPVEVDSTTGWLVNISNLSDALNTFRIKAFVSVTSNPTAVFLTNINFVGMGDSFSYVGGDSGNFRGKQGASSLRTPNIDLVNKDFWVEIDANSSDYVTFLVLASIDPDIDTSLVYAVTIEVKSINYNQTYVFEMPFTVAGSLTLEVDPQPSFAVSSVSTFNVMPGSALSLQIAISPSNAYSDVYEIEIFVPSTNCSFAFLGVEQAPQTNSFEPFSISSIVTSFNGLNVTASPTTQVDKVFITAERTGLPVNDVRLSYLYSTFTLMSGSAYNSSQSFYYLAWYNAEVSLWSDYVNVGIYNTSVTDPALSSSQNALAIQTSPALDDSFMYPWGSQAFFVNVTIPNGKTYTNIILQAQVPMSGSGNPLFDFSGVYLFDQDPELIVTINSSLLNSTNGQASITFSMIYGQNGGLVNKFRVLFTFGMPYNFALVDQTSYAIMVTASGNSLNYLQNTEAGGVVAVSANYTVFFTMQRLSAGSLNAPSPRLVLIPLTPTTVVRGGTATFDVFAELPARFNAWTELEAMIISTELPYLSVCHISPVATSSNPDYPILYTRNNGSFMTSSRGTYVWGHTTVIDPVNAIAFHMGQVSVALLNNSLMANMSTHWFTLGLGTVPWRWTFENIAITANASKYPVTGTNAFFTKKNDETTVTKSMGAVFALLVITSPNSVGRYQFDFTVTTGANIGSVVVINNGINVACMNNSGNTISVTSRDNGVTNTTWTVIVDSLANVQRSDSTDAIDNLVTVEVGVCLPTASLVGSKALAIGANLNVTAKLTVDGSVAFSGFVVSKIVQDQLTSEIPQQVNVSLMGWGNNVNYIHRSLQTLMNVSIITPLMTSAIYTINVTLPTDPIFSQAYVVVEGISVIASGKNIICTPAFSLAPSSSLGTAQNDNAQFVFGIVNSGSWAGMPDYYDYLQAWDDNQVMVGLQLRYTDHIFNLWNTVRSFNVSVSYNNSYNVMTVPVTLPPLSVSGNEAPSLQANITVVEVQPSFGTGKTLIVLGNVSHTLTSQAHGYLVKLQLFVLPYVTFVSLQSSSGSMYSPTVSNGSGESLDITWPAVLMEEVASFNLTLLVDPTQTSGSELTLYEIEIINLLTWRRLIKALAADQYATYGPPMTILPELMTNDIYSAESARGQLTFTPPSCTAPLGLTNPAVITDCMIYASSLLTSFQGRSLTSSGTMPGRLGDNNVAWVPYPRGDPFKGSEYLMVSLGAPSTIAAIDIQGDRSDATQYVVAIQLQYSVDGTRWQIYTDINGHQILSVPWRPATNHLVANEVASIVLVPTIYGASFVKIIPVEAAISATYPFLPLRVELRGCAPTTRNQSCISGSYVTPVQPGLPDTKERSYIWIEAMNIMFACSQANPDVYATCSRYDWANDDWYDVPVSAVVAYDVATSSLLGFTGYNNSVISFDGGFIWSENDRGAFDDFVAAAGIVNYESLPHSDIACNSTAEGNYGSYGFKSTGLGKYLSIKQDGIVFGSSSNAGAFINDLYYWGPGFNWLCQ